MIIESSVVIGLTYGSYRYAFRKHINEKKFKKEIQAKWNTLIDGSIKRTENKIEQRFELLKIIKKEYGFDAIVSLALEYKKLRELLPMIEIIFNGTAIVELSKSKTSAYLRVHINGLNISEKDEIRFKWYKSFVKSELRNSYGETFKIESVEDIKNINTNEVVGYKICASVPLELNYDKLEAQKDILEKSWQRKVFIKWNREKNLSECNIIFKPLSDYEEFKPIKPESEYDFYLGMTYEYKPVMTNFKYSPHLLYTGKSQTGKTVCVISGITNMAYWYDSSVFELYESMVSSKQDLRIFAKLEQCKYYARDINSSYKLFKHIERKMYERNRVFETSSKFIANMYEWNRKFPKKKMSLVLLVIDEMTVYMPKDSDSKDVKDKKKECLAILWNLMIEGASAGINVLFSLQRPDKESFPPQLKAQIGSKVGFFQPNTASSLTAMDSEACTKIAMKREAIVQHGDGIDLMKTLYLTSDMVESLLKDKMQKNKQYIDLDDNGNIVKPKLVEQVENVINLTSVNADNNPKESNQPTHTEKQRQRSDKYKEKKTKFRR